MLNRGQDFRLELELDDDELGEFIEADTDDDDGAEEESIGRMLDVMRNGPRTGMFLWRDGAAKAGAAGGKSNDRK